MTDSLFLIQRYLGSDDDCDEEEIPQKSQVLDSTKKRRKDKTKIKNKEIEIATKEQVENDVVENGVQELTVSDSTTIEAQSPPKKKQKKKRADKEIEFFTNEHHEVEDNVTENGIHEQTVSDFDTIEVKSPKTKRKKGKGQAKDSDQQHDDVATKTQTGDEKSLNDDLAEEKLRDSTSIAPQKEKNSDHSMNEAISAASQYTIIGEVKSKSDEVLKRELPDWLAHPTIVSVGLDNQKEPVSEMSYLDSVTKKNLAAQGIQYLFPVQQAVVPWLMQCDNRRLLARPPDLCVSSPTGSGKTLAFVLPIVQSLRDRVVCRTRALVVLPVADLAWQVGDVFQKFCRGTQLKTVVVCGKKPLQVEQENLVKSGIRGPTCLADIVITTPGRLLDHVRNTPGFTLKYLRYLVIDEADRMMKEIQEGWLKQVESAIFGERTPRSGDQCCLPLGDERVIDFPSTAYSYGRTSEPLQKLLYSATLSQDPEALHSLSLYRPKLFSAQDTLGTCAATPDTLSELCVVCRGPAKPMVIAHLVKSCGFKRVLCFTDRVERAHRLKEVLTAMGGLKVAELSSAMLPVQRKVVLGRLQTGKLDILVCSDMASRGMDIHGVDCVLSYDAPRMAKTYVHRSGRTARAGQPGTTVTLLSNFELPCFRRMLTKAGKEMPHWLHVNEEELEPYMEPFQAALTRVNVVVGGERRDKHFRRTGIKRKRT